MTERDLSPSTASGPTQTGSEAAEGALHALAERYEQHNTFERGRNFAVARDERGSFFASRIGTGKEILDLGCRDGTMAAVFQAGNEVTGADIDREALRVAGERGLDPVWTDLSAPRRKFGPA